MPINLILHLLLFLAGLAVLGKVATLLEERFIQVANALRISEFFVGFLILGFATSLPEFSVLVNSLFLQTPTLSLGNLSGGIFVIFGLLLPLRAVIGHGLPFKGRFGVRELSFTLFFIALPFLLISLLGPRPSTGAILILSYPFLVLFISRHYHAAKSGEEMLRPERHRLRFWSMLSGLALLLFLLFAAADLTVYAARQITQATAVPGFLFGLTFLSLGTNLPELSILLTSLRSPAKSKVAVGDLLGSASVNVLLIGLLLLVSPAVSFSTTSFLTTTIAALALLSLFLLFSLKHQEITLKEGVVLILLYLVFTMGELVF